MKQRGNRRLLAEILKGERHFKIPSPAEGDHFLEFVALFGRWARMSLELMRALLRFLDFAYRVACTSRTRITRSPSMRYFAATGAGVG
jgi:hypothetical protein